MQPIRDVVNTSLSNKDPWTIITRTLAAVGFVYAIVKLSKNYQGGFCSNIFLLVNY